ncbi:LPD23 domain-containing protein [Iodobacter sp. CM08]|uniref:ADP-ribosyltransferase-containing protein n=1 Tax=Iodobacter sp. CM08 TaxID=3085902 RepID=UPI0029821A6B|nr:LPD23 domain-containing protein [Iodobacter sp. CM08]MDW5418723.1 LPD23 domain-containing protein [Iodobacter sp. CM08]
MSAILRQKSVSFRMDRFSSGYLRSGHQWTAKGINENGPTYRNALFSIEAILHRAGVENGDFADDALPLGHAVFIAEDSKVYDFAIRDSSDRIIGCMSAQVDVYGDISAIHDIELRDFVRGQGLGRQVVASIVSNRPDPILIVDMIPQARAFWNSIGVTDERKTTPDGYFIENGEIDWDGLQLGAGRIKQIEISPTAGHGIAGLRAKLSRQTDHEKDQREQVEAYPFLASKLKTASSLDQLHHLANSQYPFGSDFLLHDRIESASLPAGTAAFINGQSVSGVSAIYADGKTHLFTDALKSPAEAELILLRTRLAREGFLAAQGSPMESMLIRLAESNPDWFEARVEQNHLTQSRGEQIASVLSEFPTNELADGTGWESFVQEFVRYLARNGYQSIADVLGSSLNGKPSEAYEVRQLVADLVREPWAWIRNDAVAPMNAYGAPPVWQEVGSTSGLSFAKPASYDTWIKTRDQEELTQRGINAEGLPIDLSMPGGDAMVTELRTAVIGKTLISYQLKKDRNNEWHVHLKDLRTPKAHRRQKFGTQAVEALLRACDRLHLPVQVEASALERSTTSEVLFKFYKSLGFTPLSQQVNLLGHAIMVRAPEGMPALEKIPQKSIAELEVEFAATREDESALFDDEGQDKYQKALTALVKVSMTAGRLEIQRPFCAKGMVAITGIIGSKEGSRITFFDSDEMPIAHAEYPTKEEGLREFWTTCGLNVGHVGGNYLPEHVEVDGQFRSTKNSNGHFIHSSTESIRNFWRWFGKSSAVDEQGRPLVLFHGTAAQNNFSVFESDIDDASGAGQQKFWFSDSPDLASSYAQDASMESLRLAMDAREAQLGSPGSDGLYQLYKSELESANELADSIQKAAIAETTKLLAETMPGIASWPESAVESMASMMWRETLPDAEMVDAQIVDAQKAAVVAQAKLNKYMLDQLAGEMPARVMPVYLRMMNTAVQDEDGLSIEGVPTFEAIQSAKETGRDGLVFKNISDRGYIANNFVVFDSKQIKSVIGNTGRYDGQERDVRFSMRVVPERSTGKIISGAIEHGVVPNVTLISGQKAYALLEDALYGGKDQGLKRSGKDRPHENGHFIMVNIPLDWLSPNTHGDLFDEFIDRDLSTRYVEEFIDTPLHIEFGIGQAAKGSTYASVLDGKHRLTAARVRGDLTIPCLISSSEYLRLVQARQIAANLQVEAPSTTDTFSFVDESTAPIDLAALSQASAMELKGDNPRDIWSTTGFFRAPWDQSWRWERDDRAENNFGWGWKNQLAQFSQYAKQSQIGAIRKDVLGQLEKSNQRFDQVHSESKHEADVVLDEIQQMMSERGKVANQPVAKVVLGLLNVNSIVKEFKLDPVKVASLWGNETLVSQAVNQWVSAGVWDQKIRAAEVGMSSAVDQYRRQSSEVEKRLMRKRASMSPDERRAAFPLDQIDAPVSAVISPQGLLAEGAGEALGADHVISPAEAIAARLLGVPDRSVSEVVRLSVNELTNRDAEQSQIPSNGTVPALFKRYPLGSAALAQYGDVEEERYVRVLTEFNANDLLLSEPESDIKKTESFTQYLNWSELGIEAPYIGVNESDNGQAISINRRRTLVAQELGKPIKGWFSPIHHHTGLPLKYGDVIAAVEAAKRLAFAAPSNGAAGVYAVADYKDVRSLAKDIRSGSSSAIKEAAEKMAGLVPANAILVPLPNSSGYAHTSLSLAKSIAAITGSEVRDVLKSDERESSYRKKLNGLPTTVDQMGLKLAGDDIPTGRIVLVGNVLATGTTLSAARKVFGRDVEMVAYAVDTRVPYAPIDPAQEVAAVRQQYEGTAQWLKDPQGNKTQLSERQWLTVRTPSFKAWFGDWENDAANASKGVSESGEPKVYFHGSPKSGFKEFDPEAPIAKKGTGTFFSDTLSMAKSYSGSGDDAPTYTAEQLLTNPALLNGLSVTQGIVVGLEDGTNKFYFEPDEALEDVLLEEGAELEYSVGYLISFEGEEIECGRAEALEFLDQLPLKQPGVYDVFLNLRDSVHIDWESKNWDNGPEEKVWHVLDADGDEDWVYSEEEANEMADSGAQIQVGLNKQYESTNHLALEAKHMGADSVQIQNVCDTGAFGSHEEANIVIVYDPTQIKCASNNIGTFSSKTSDIRFSFAGESAATLDEAALALAKEMEQKGADPRDIWTETGFFRAPWDNKFRWEIDDRSASVRDENQRGWRGNTYREWNSDVALKSFANEDLNRPVSVMNALTHSQLMSAYPSLKQVRVATTPELADGNAAFIGSENLIKIFDRDYEIANVNRNVHQIKNKGEEWLRQRKTDDLYLNERPLLLHELQHAVQQIEGFASGGNLDTKERLKTELATSLEKFRDGSSEYNQIREELNALYSDLRLEHWLALSQKEGGIKPSAIRKTGEWQKWGLKVTSDLGNMPRAAGHVRDQWVRDAAWQVYQLEKEQLNIPLAWKSHVFEKGAKNVKQRITQLQKKAKAHLEDKKQFDSVLTQFKQVDKLSSHGVYQRLAGEAEARLTMRRAGLSAEERRARYPLDDLDVSLDELIARFDHGLAEHVENDERFTVVESLRGVYGDQLNLSMTLQMESDTPGETRDVAVVDFSEWRGTVNIEMMSVPEDARRKGFATKLITELQKKHPETEINFGMLSAEGKSWYDSLPKQVVRSAYADQFDRLKAAHLQLENLKNSEAILNNPETGWTEEISDLYDQINSVSDEIEDLERDLYGKRPTCVLIDTGLVEHDLVPVARQHISQLSAAKSKFSAINHRAMMGEKIDLHEFEESLDAMMSAQEKAKGSLAALLDNGDGFVSGQSGILKFVLHNSAKVSGEWQLTRLNSSDEPIGDTHYPDVLHAIEHFLADAEVNTLEYNGLALCERDADLAAEVLRSATAAPPMAASKEAVEALVEAAFGVTLKSEGAGRIVVVQSVKDLPAELRADVEARIALMSQSPGREPNPRGLYDNVSNDVYLIADGFEQESLGVEIVRSVVMHEGWHWLVGQSQDLMYSSTRLFEKLDEVFKQCDQSMAEGRQEDVPDWIINSVKSIPRGTPKKLVVEEFAAHAVEHASVDHPDSMIARWRDQLNAASLRAGFLPDQLDDKALACLGRFAVREMTNESGIVDQVATSLIQLKRKVDEVLGITAKWWKSKTAPAAKSVDRQEEHEPVSYLNLRDEGGLERDKGVSPIQTPSMMMKLGGVIKFSGTREVELCEVCTTMVPEKIDSPYAAALATRYMSRFAQENIVALVMDKENRPLSIVRHTVGQTDQAPLLLSILSGSVLQIPEAAKFWVVHNHTGASFVLSNADLSSMNQVGALVQDSRIECEGIIAVTDVGFGYAKYEGAGVNQVNSAGQSNWINAILPMTAKIPVQERLLMMRDPGVPYHVYGSDDVLKIIDAAKIESSGLLAMTTRLQAVSFIPVDDADMDRYRGKGWSDLLAELSSMNAVKIIAVLGATTKIDKWENLYAGLRAANLELIDAFRLSEGGQVRATKETQLLAPSKTTRNVFFSCAPEGAQEEIQHKKGALHDFLSSGGYELKALNQQRSAFLHEPSETVKNRLGLMDDEYEPGKNKANALLAELVTQKALHPVATSVSLRLDENEFCASSFVDGRAQLLMRDLRLLLALEVISNGEVPVGLIARHWAEQTKTVINDLYHDDMDRDARCKIAQEINHALCATPQSLDLSSNKLLDPFLSAEDWKKEAKTMLQIPDRILDMADSYQARSVIIGLSTDQPEATCLCGAGGLDFATKEEIEFRVIPMAYIDRSAASVVLGDILKAQTTADRWSVLRNLGNDIGLKMIEMVSHEHGNEKKDPGFISLAQVESINDLVSMPRVVSYDSPEFH